MTFHSPVSTTSILFEHVLATVPTSAPAADYVISGFPEYEVDLTSDQRNVLNRIATEIVNSQSGPNPVSALVITGHADRDLRANNPKHQPGETRAQFEMRMSDSRARSAAELLKSRIKDLKGPGSTALLDELLSEPKRIKTVPLGASDLLVQNPSSESERALNRRVEFFLVRTVQPPPPQPADPFSKRVQRAARLIEGGRKVDPDSTGTRTKRAYEFLQQMLKPGVNDKFVDGEKSNETVNGKRALDERGMPTALCAYPGKYDPPSVSAADEEKFFDHAFPILKGPGWAPSESDETILKIMGGLVLRIDQGINLTDEYIAHNVELIAGGYLGDQARKKLQQEYVKRMTDQNDIYWAFRSRL
jgi:outer membrane protein OmpA-like peptidoglycan-associated protein